MADEHVVGVDAKMYYNSATHATPTWVEIARATDVSVSLTKGEATLDNRESVYKMYGGGLIDASIEFGYLHVTGNADTVFDALQASFASGTAIQIAVMDGAIATSDNVGFRAFCECFDMSYDQELEEGMKFNFVFKPTRHVESSSLVPPDWYEVA